MKSYLQKGISILEIAGGAWGIILICWAIYKLQASLGWHYILWLFPFMFLYLLSLFAGLSLWQNKLKGFNASIIIQAIQIPQFSLGGLLFYFCSGLDLGPRLYFHDSGGGFKFHFYFGGSFQANYDPQSTFIMFGINIFALFALLYLLKHKNELATKGMEM